MKNVAVILSGCGYLDGAEIREAVLTLLYLDAQGATAHCFAPDMSLDEVDHLTANATGNTRNALAESARIARGEIKPLAEAQAADFDALILPGGFGAAKNLSDFATKGAGCTVLPEVKTLIQAFHQAGKPIGAMCIAPAVLATALGDHSPTVTIGEDEGTAEAIKQCGGVHQNAASEECVVDEKNKLVTCSAYMRDDRISTIAKGIEKTVNATLAMA